MRIFSIITVLFLLGSPAAFAAIDSTHVGFVDSSLWFDREPFFAGQEVRVYTTLANSSTADFNGVVEFYNGEETIGSANVTLERNGGFQVLWADWTPEEGNHRVSVKITEAFLTPEGGKPEQVTYGNESSYSLERFIDTDTDGDGIGNKEDTDDDNDGIPDSEDAEPLVKVAEETSFEPLSIKENLEDKSTQIISKVGEVASSTSPKIIAGVEKVIDVVERFRITQSENINKELKQTKQRIKEDQAGLEDGDTSEGEEEKKNAPFNQLQLLALTAAGYTLSHKIAFYITGAFILYFLLKKFIPWMFRLVRGRKDEY